LFTYNELENMNILDLL